MMRFVVSSYSIQLVLHRVNANLSQVSQRNYVITIPVGPTSCYYKSRLLTGLFKTVKWGVSFSSRLRIAFLSEMLYFIWLFKSIKNEKKMCLGNVSFSSF